MHVGNEAVSNLRALLFLHGIILQESMELGGISEANKASTYGISGIGARLKWNCYRWEYEAKGGIVAVMAGALLIRKRLGWRIDMQDRAKSSRAFQRPQAEALESRTLLAADLTAAFVRGLPGTFPPRQTGSAILRVKNVGDTAAVGQARVNLFASTIPVLTSSAAPLTSELLELRLAPQRSITVKMTYSTPNNLPDAEYFTIADIESVTFVDSNASNNQVASRYVTEIVPPVVDLAAMVGSTEAQVKLRGNSPSGKISAPLVISDVGNAPARGTVSATIYLSTSTQLDSGAIAIGSMPVRGISLLPGKRSTVPIATTLRASVPSDEYHLLVQIAPSGGISDTNVSNDVGYSPRLVKVSNPNIAPAPIFSGSLQSDTSVLFIGQASNANIELTISREVPAASVELDEVDSAGNVLMKVGNLFDDGAIDHNDISASDGAFNNSISLSFAQPGSHYYAARALAASGAVRKSNIITINVVQEPSWETLYSAGEISGAVYLKMVGDLREPHPSVYFTLRDAVSVLTAEPDKVIQSSIVTTDQSVAWETIDGIETLMDCNQVYYQGVRGGGSISDSSTTATIKATQTSVPPHNALLIAAGGTQFDPSDEAKSSSAPFAAAGWSIATGSESTTDFTNLSSYGAIVVTAHGDVIPGIGPVIDARGIPNNTASLLDLLNHRTILENSADIAITPNFIVHYAGRMPGTVVYVGGCSSMADASLANAFLHQGASAFIGYSGPVSNTFAFEHGMTVIRTLLSKHRNRVADIPKINKATDSTGAKLQAMGNLKARIT